MGDIDLDHLRGNTPPAATLRPYTDAPLSLGHLYDETGSKPTFGIPTDRQRRHQAIIGGAGAGKTVTLQKAVHTNARRTNGIDVVVDPKGGFAENGFLQLWYHDHSDLSDVTVINAREELLQLPLFDLRPHLQTDLTVTRSRLIEIVINAGMTVLKTAAVTDENFTSAGQSVELLRSLLYGLFHAGYDQVSFDLLFDVLDDVESANLTLDVDHHLFQRYLDTVVEDDPQTRRHITNGARRRLAPIARNPLLAESIATPPDEQAHQFNFLHALDRDEVIIIDTGGLDAAVRSQLARLILSRFFRAGRLRQQLPTSDAPLANLYLDEAHVLGDANILLDLLSEGRAFDISLTLLSQTLSQFGDEAQSHISGNVGTLLACQADEAMGEAIAGGPFGSQTARHLVERIPAGDWLVRVRPRRNRPVPRPFLIDAGPLPRVHPEHPDYDTLESGARDACRKAIRRSQARVSERADVVTIAPSSANTDTDRDISRGLRHTLWLDSAELPDGAHYDDTTDRVCCTTCGDGFLPSLGRLYSAITHCGDNGDLSETHLPITNVDLGSVDIDRVRMAPLSIREIMFLRLIERACNRAINPQAWDLITETMTPLRNAAELDADDVTRLVEQGYVSKQDNLQGNFYQLGTEGRQLLHRLRDGDPAQEIRTQTDDDINPDPNESVVHIRGVETAARALDQLVSDDDTPIDNVQRYWSPEEDPRTLDLVGFDNSGTPIVCVEMERATNDHAEAVPADFDLMADQSPTVALWIVPDRATGHQVIRHLVAPKHGPSRLSLTEESLNSASTPLDRYDLSADGCTDVCTLSKVSADRIRALLSA